MLLYALTILVSAFLLFQVQPVIAKIILPWFGGSAAVWTTCLLFFQMELLLGYFYAHAVVRYLKPRVQTQLHLALLLISVATATIYPRAAWQPAGGEEPTFAILKLLVLTVGLPYFLLSTTGPLIQAWYARRFKGAMPYRLYALSNAGSMFALISYPVLFEPVFGTKQQASLWSMGYGLFIALCAVTAYRSRAGAAIEAVAEAGPDERPGARQFALWLALPACASVLLLATTNHLSQNVAAIPFLWVLPLSIYLLSFILCFESSGWYRRHPYIGLLAVALATMAYAHAVDSSGSVGIKVLVPLYSMGLFTCCMVCHGELARMKPNPRYLTHFYLMISAGGAIGGLFVGLLAPRVFQGLYEFQIGIAGCGIVTLMVLHGDPEYQWFSALLRPVQLALAAAIAAAASFVVYATRGPLLAQANRIAKLFPNGDSDSRAVENSMVLGVMVILAIVVLIAVRGGKMRGRIAAIAAEAFVLVLIGYIGYHTRQLTADYRVSVRNFYGALRVRDSGSPTEFEATRTLTHGTINHGEQFLMPARRDLPTTYYGPGTGVGLAIREQGKARAIRVGVIGLGTGTLAAYGRQGDYYRFYEINPLVLRLARTEFTFLNDCKAKLDVAMGDARLSLENEAPEKFDVLAVDAFSSDSIPVHLLTREAMRLYFGHLNTGGILAVHISNRYLDLQPVLDGEVKALGKVARMVDNDEDESQDVFSATWVLIADPAPGFSPDIVSHSTEIESHKAIRLWTDDYSNLFQILK